MKQSYFTFILLMLFAVAFGQSKPTNYNFQNTVSETLFDANNTEVVEIYSLQTLGKTAWQNHLDTTTISKLPKDFNWYTDSHRIESIKNMVSTVQKQDLCGRDLPPIDLHAEVIQNVYIKSLYVR